MNAHFYEPKKKDSKILAFADVDVADGVIVKGFRIIRGVRGLFASVPTRTFTVAGRTQYMHQVVFANSETREGFLAKILEDYQRWERERSDSSNPVESHAPANELVE